MVMPKPCSGDFKPYFRSKTYPRKYEKLTYIVIHACKNITEKTNLLNMCGPQIRLCLVTFRSIAPNQLNSNRYSQLTRWCKSDASALGERGPGYNSRLRQRFLCLIVCFVVVFTVSVP